MRKRIVALLLCIVSVCSLFLLSCKKEVSDDERRKSIVEGGETAYTISVWLPVTAEVMERYQSDSTTVTNIEREINQILASRNMATAVKFVLIDENEYSQKITEQFEVSKEAVTVANPNNSKYSEIYKKQNNKGPLYPNAIGTTYRNSAIKVDLLDSNGNSTGEYVFELDYPDLLQATIDGESKTQQVDICFIGNYNDLLTWANGGHLYSLSDYLSSSGKYTSLNKIVKQNYMNAMKVNDKIQAIPNNHLFSVDKYQVVLIDKAIAGDKIVFDEKTGAIKYNDAEINTILGCKDYINDIAASGTGAIPFVGTINDASGVVYWGENSIISSSINGSNPDNILANKDYVDYVTFYKELQDLGYTKTLLAKDEKAAVEIKYATLAQIQEYEKDYYVIKSGSPIVEDFSSMFAISQYSINYDRAMAVLNLFMTNEKIITLLNYGVKGVDYKIDENGIVSNLNTFKLNKYRFGNGYATYYNYGMSDEIWEYVKQINYDAVISPFIKSEYAKKSTDLSKITANYEAIKTVSAEIFEIISGMNAEEFTKLVAAYDKYASTDVSAKCEILAKEALYNEHSVKIEEYKTKIEANDARIAEINEAMKESNEDDDSALETEKASLTDENTQLKENIDFVEQYNELIDDKTELEILNKFCGMQEYKDALSESQSFYSKLQ